MTPNSDPRDLADLYHATSDAVEMYLDGTLFLSCGSLLGLVRDGGWIKDDDDMDTAFILPGGAEGAPAALVELAAVLNRTGLDAHVSQPMRSHLHVHHPDRYEARIDVFVYWFENGQLHIPSGVATKSGGVSSIDGFVGGIFEGIAVDVPANYEALLEQIYGPDWRTPRTGSDWNWAEHVQRQDRVNVVSEATAREVETWRRADLQFRDDCEKR